MIQHLAFIWLCFVGIILIVGTIAFMSFLAKDELVTFILWIVFIAVTVAAAVVLN